MTDANAVMTESAPQANQETLESMTPAQREHWRLTGEMQPPKKESSATPEKLPQKKEASAAASEELEEEESSEEPEAAAESEPARTQKRTGTPAPQRIKELLAERKRDREQLAEANRRLAALEQRQPEPRPALERKEVVVAAKKELRAEPQLDDKDRNGKDKYEDFNSYIKDLRKWDDERHEAQLAQQREDLLKEFDTRQDKRTKEQEAARTNQVISQEWGKRVNEARKRYDDFDAVALDKMVPIREGSVADAFVLESQYGPDVLYYLATNPDELERLQGRAIVGADGAITNFVGGLNPIAQARALLEIEQQFSKPSKKEKKAQQEQLEEEFEEEEEEPVLPAKKVSAAPPPPRETASRGTRPLSEEKAAGARGDVAGYMKAANARELAAMRRRSS
jgi:hypothetical protein